MYPSTTRSTKSIKTCIVFPNNIRNRCTPSNTPHNNADYESLPSVLSHSD